MRLPERGCFDQEKNSFIYLTIAITRENGLIEAGSVPVSRCQSTGTQESQRWEGKYSIEPARIR